MHRLLVACAFALSCLPAAAGTSTSTAAPALHAAPSAPGTPGTPGATWLCALSHDLVRLVCVADDAPAAVAAPEATVTAVVNGTRFPLDPRRMWVVDLWSPATEPERVAELARATICYRSPGCAVVMGGPLAQR